MTMFTAMEKVLAFNYKIHRSAVKIHITQYKVKYNWLCEYYLGWSLNKSPPPCY